MYEEKAGELVKEMSWLEAFFLTLQEAVEVRGHSGGLSCTLASCGKKATRKADAGLMAAPPVAVTVDAGAGGGSPVAAGAEGGGQGGASGGDSGGLAGQVEDGSIDGGKLGSINLAAVHVLLDPGDYEELC